MRRRVVLAGLAALALAVPANAATLAEIVPLMKPGIVGVGVYVPLGAPPAQLRATGFVVEDGRHIVTNYHAVAKKPEATENERLVVFTGRGFAMKALDAKIVATHPNVDLALLEFEGEPLPALKLAPESAELQEGADVAITGFPIAPVFGMYHATHRGTLAALTPNVMPQVNARQLTAEMIRAPRFEIYQLDMVAFPGNSGSPLYDPETGLVHGVVQGGVIRDIKEGGLTNPTGITYAIPAKYVRELLKRERVAP